MGKKMDALLGKGFKTSKFKNLVELVSSRVAVLEKQHRLKCMQAQSDVVALLKLGHHESAFLRVELVIIEQNMLDAYAMIENFCNLLVDRVVLIENNRECPDETKEAISSLIFAASKCGEFQELEKISSMLTKRFGKEFATNAVDLCSNCGVCPKDIALANGIDLHLEGGSPMVTEETKLDTNEEQLKPHESTNNDKCKLQHGADPLSIKEQKQGENVPEEVKSRMNYRDSKAAEKRELRHGDDRLSINEQKQGEKIPDEGMRRRKYKDFKAAAQAAYKLAVNAAVAARAAVELAEPLDKSPDCPRKSTEKKFATHFDESSKSDNSFQGNETAEKKFQTNELETQKIDAEVISGSSPESKKIGTNNRGHLKGD
ncbi:Vacuolar protein sorting-associated protein [Parasponia andersonii]|uniref:Vacuolar protein sorting-associated protein n=1 Tax=Parasponia andersonii TaxID=3476 RepID=A0A2P5DY35_PARAD|nr:Vacuolar protein sorting-associated protein [Parasponia andersonii]